MNRNYLALLLLAAMAMAIGGMACADTMLDLDRDDEGIGAT